MGWDAYAVRSGEEWRQANAHGDFAVAAAIVEAQAGAGAVDGLLRYGALDCSVCAEALQRATGRDPWGEDWSPETVKALAETASWEFETTKELEWAKASAKAFLETAAALGLGVKFSW